MTSTVPSGDALADSPLSAIRGVVDYWERQTLRSARPTASAMADRILLDVLGIGIEQALTYLPVTRPDFRAFEDWVIATAGRPDAESVARYHAWLDGHAPPAATAARLAAVDVAQPVLGLDELKQWAESGYVVLRGAISASEAAAAADLLWQVTGAAPDDPASWYGARTNGIMIQSFQHPALEVARRAPRIHKAFAQLLGTSDLWTATDRMSFNPPATAAHPFPGPRLHWDTSLAHPIPLAVGGILYLTDTAADQGALQVVSGLHLRLRSWIEGLDGVDPRTADLSADAVTVPAGAGDLVIWRQELAHGASPNTSDRPRLAQYVAMYDPAVPPHAEWR
ncbi:phytanoyl-CoA dioxygenase family protein [Sphingomonas donggukensis]|uniref:Phytanoyl-CoA dioxygenase family protein n=1 Tax=Sphingomonas donggukensis TaxID=2949093 RepID=A0ABY4TSV0_9SPHN|nr:phytanoyl-CoA dioxygenase family protein [Sphingomonas donggukensis]URW74487.1 phytanoyl-CoA dioxygenase family protein [Sphingomonas donggukensis]